MKRYAKLNAFTLAELLVSVLIISIIMVVLAPVLTKRAAMGDFGIGGGGSGSGGSGSNKAGRLFLFDKTDSYCTEATDGENSLDCTFETGSGVQEVGVIMVSAGGGGAGATNPTRQYNVAETAANTTKEVKIVNGMANVRISYLSGGGGGGGGAVSVEQSAVAGLNQEICNQYNARYVTGDQNGTGVASCVLKYNIGDIPDATNGGIAPSVTVASVQQDCTAERCCWQGKTGGSCMYSACSYSGCNRTVCTWQAASDSCAQLAYKGTSAGDWRLPTKKEASSWRTVMRSINYQRGNSGLMLCGSEKSSIYSKYDPALCTDGYDCDGAPNDGTCKPSKIWLSDSVDGSANHYAGYMSVTAYSESKRSSYITFSTPSTNSLQPTSVRCVMTKVPTSSTVYSGGGGGGAPYFKDYVIPEAVINNSMGGKIVLSGGSGGEGKTTGDGDEGEVSTIMVYNQYDAPVWGIRAYGGNGGKVATSTNYGAGATSATKCEISENGSSWSLVACGSGGAGGNGETASVSGSGAATGGKGGGSMYSSSTLDGGGSGGDTITENGYSGSRYGAGGGGATVRYQSSTKYQGKGGNGASGVAEILYDIQLPPAGGGGGGGGAFLKVDNIPVTPSTTYTIRVGGGGKGGAVANDGSDGGESKVTFGSNEYVLIGGKGGKAGTSATVDSAAIHGVGGSGAINGLPSGAKRGNNGYDGSDSTLGCAGGSGGKSGIGNEGGCGALFDNGSTCSPTTTGGLSSLFVAPGNLLSAAEYGSAGAGGGGGGWSHNSTAYPYNNPGTGGDGQDGYVYIYWTDYTSN